MKKEISDLCDEKKMTMITQLIGLGEAQRRIYEAIQPTGKLEESYKLHQQELKLLIKYQKEGNKI